jgi:hypothetical protein
LAGLPTSPVKNRLCTFIASSTTAVLLLELPASSTLKNTATVPAGVT